MSVFKSYKNNFGTVTNYSFLMFNNHLKIKSFKKCELIAFPSISTRLFTVVPINFKVQQMNAK
jgi:hypothetical protein